MQEENEKTERKQYQRTGDRSKRARQDRHEWVSHGVQKIRRKVIQEKMERTHDSKRKKYMRMTQGRNIRCRQDRGRQENQQARKERQTSIWTGREPRERQSKECRGGEEWRSRGGRGGAGGEEKRVMWRDLALESGGWFIKCSKVQVEKVRMDLTCLRRW